MRVLGLWEGLSHLNSQIEELTGIVASYSGSNNIEHLTMYLSKYISKGAVDLIFSPGVGNNPSYPYIQTKQVQKFRTQSCSSSVEINISCSVPG